MFDICTDVHFDSHMSVRLPIVDRLVFGGDLAKPASSKYLVECFKESIVNTANMNDIWERC